MHEHKSPGITMLYISLAVSVIALAGGGYVYFRVYQKDKASDAIVTAAQNALNMSERQRVEAELESARLKALEQISRLNSVKSASGGSISANLRSAYFTAQVAVSVRTDPILEKSLTTNIISDQQLAIDIGKARGNINEMLSQWKEASKSTEKPTEKSKSLAETYLPYIKTYLEELENIVSELDPENSGLTEEEIEEYKESVETAIKEIEQAISDIQNTEETGGDEDGTNGDNTDTSGGGTGDTNDESESTNEEGDDQDDPLDEILDEIEETQSEIEDLQDDLNDVIQNETGNPTDQNPNDSNDNGSDEDTPKPFTGLPKNPISPDAPELIQGENSF